MPIHALSVADTLFSLVKPNNPKKAFVLLSLQVTWKKNDNEAHLEDHLECPEQAEKDPKKSSATANRTSQSCYEGLTVDAKR